MFIIMYSVVISPEHYSNNEIKALIELYRTYNRDMSPAFYRPDKVVFTKGMLSSKTLASTVGLKPSKGLGTLDDLLTKSKTAATASASKLKKAAAAFKAGSF